MGRYLYGWTRDGKLIGGVEGPAPKKKDGWAWVVSVCCLFVVVALALIHFVPGIPVGK